MSAKKSKKKKTIKLVSTANTGIFFVKNKGKNQVEKMSFKKYDPVVRKHVIFKEKTMK